VIVAKLFKVMFILMQEVIRAIVSDWIFELWGKIRNCDWLRTGWEFSPRLSSSSSTPVLTTRKTCENFNLKEYNNFI